ncbi:hypothetical protein GCM10010172_35400 [Paractinoplanes ferrugineus]|uniref:HNH nuclease domain-containing protein n=1 Tax=Paractinoplanes ferrugineus TaxID=113564 RepID=A0A919JBP1_9ACTN|nr:HNH endonuclease signature motif containing protein [Actinoplanes ferrugineus]GIE16872.1 hypothetical protein Afe05nite_87120 [Actinoplanes ferrugineus]
MKKTELKRLTPLASTSQLRRTALPASPASRSTKHANMPKPRPRNTGPLAAVLRILAARSEGLCEFWQCLEDAAHTHHRRPRRMGGSSVSDTNQPSNLLRLCPDHHEWVESQRAKALELGLLLHAGAVPAEVPVLTRHGEVFLIDDGTYVEAPR